MTPIKIYLLTRNYSNTILTLKSLPMEILAYLYSLEVYYLKYFEYFVL